MSTQGRQLLAALAAVLVVLAGCGKDEEREGEGLPRAQVSALDARLDEIQRRYSDARDNDNPGACADIETDSFPEIQSILASLPKDVDVDLLEATEESFARLRELTSKGCAEVEPSRTETETTPAEPEPVPTETTETQTETQTETTPPRTETTPRRDGNDGNGGGTPSAPGGGGLEAPGLGGD